MLRIDGDPSTRLSSRLLASSAQDDGFYVSLLLAKRLLL